MKTMQFVPGDLVLVRGEATQWGMRELTGLHDQKGKIIHFLNEDEFLLIVSTIMHPTISTLSLEWSTVLTRGSPIGNVRNSCLWKVETIG